MDEIFKLNKLTENLLLQGGWIKSQPSYQCVMFTKAGSAIYFYDSGEIDLMCADGSSFVDLTLEDIALAA